MAVERRRAVERTEGNRRDRGLLRKQRVIEKMEGCKGGRGGHRGDKQDIKSES